MKPFLLAAGLLCGATCIQAQSPGATSLNDMVLIAMAERHEETAPDPAPTPQLIDEIQKAVATRRDADDALAAPAAWAYRSRDGAILTDAGGSFAVERWPCHLLPGRSCFAGIFAGKKTVGAGLGVALRKAVMAKGLQVVAFAAFVVPYDEGGKLAFAPALGVAIKF